MDGLQVWTFFTLLIGHHPTWAINTCSHTVSYRELCPNPMFVTGGGSVPDSDLSINLTSRGETPSSCDFFKDKDEVSAIGGIHVSSTPWSFHMAAPCTHVVKLVLDLETHYGKKEKEVCHRALGMKVHGNSYLWHNFTLSSHHASFVDLITNYGQSPSDVLCTHSPKFILIIILTSKNSKCSLLVQQYRYDESGKGCESVQYPPPYRFCGAYPCSGSESNNILQGIKLIDRQSVRTNKAQNGGGGGGQNNYYSPKSSVPSSEDDESEEVVTEPTTTTTTAISHEKDSSTTETPEIPMDEWVVRLFFPVFGVAFIFLLLYILKGKYADEICGRVRRDSQYHGSIMSMEKQGLQLQL